jgi:hypothetical protein
MVRKPLRKTRQQTPNAPQDLIVKEPRSSAITGRRANPIWGEARANQASI